MILKYLLPIWQKEEKQGVAAFEFAMELAQSVESELYSVGDSDLESQAIMACFGDKRWPKDRAMASRFSDALKAGCVLAACRCSAGARESPKQLSAIYYFATRESALQRKGRVKRDVADLTGWVTRHFAQFRHSANQMEEMLGGWIMEKTLLRELTIKDRPLALVVGGKVCGACSEWELEAEGRKYFGLDNLQNDEPEHSMPSKILHAAAPAKDAAGRLLRPDELKLVMQKVHLKLAGGVLGSLSTKEGTLSAAEIRLVLAAYSLVSAYMNLFCRTFYSEKLPTSFAEDLFASVEPYLGSFSGTASIAQCFPSQIEREAMSAFQSDARGRVLPKDAPETALWSVRDLFAFAFQGRMQMLEAYCDTWRHRFPTTREGTLHAQHYSAGICCTEWLFGCAEKEPAKLRQVFSVVEEGTMAVVEYVVPVLSGATF